MFQDDADDYGPAPNPHNGDFEDIGWQALGPAIAFVVLSTSVVALRWWTRSRLVRCVGWDDYVILLSMLLAWTSCAIIGAAVHEGVGLIHPGSNETETVTKLVVANNCVWALTVNVTKASILMQYLRVFSGRLTRTSCYLLLAALVPAVLWAICGGVWLCRPVAKLWKPELPGHCMSAQQYWLSVAGIDIGLDFLVLLLPLQAIASLHLPRKQKISLLLVFLLGFSVCGVSVARLATVLALSNQGRYVVSAIWAIIWSVVEANVGISCACLMALRPLVGYCWPDLMHETEPPKHSMRLRDAHAQVAGLTWASEAQTLVDQVSPPPTMKSKRESTVRSSLPTSVSDSTPYQAEPRRPSSARHPNGSEIDVWDMLRNGI